jgi:hypothetical protein
MTAPRRPARMGFLAASALPVVLAAAFAAALAPVGAASAQGGAARVDRFVPEGDVKGGAKGVREVSARFSERMTALGDPRVARDLFDVDCPEKGQARWADGRTWVYVFARDLPPGVRCRFTLRADARTLTGAPLAGRRAFGFSTGGPTVLQTMPWGGMVAEDQRFVLKLDAEPTRDSIERHVAFLVRGLRDPVGVRVVEGPERDAALESLGEKPGDRRFVLVEARQRFAPESQLVLRVGPGLRTQSGVASEAAQRFEFETRAPFAARTSCARENAKADCVPLLPVRLRFSAPVPFARASALALRGEGGSFPAERAYADEADPFVDAVVFRGPFPPNATLRLELPPDLRDDAGRALEGASALVVRTAAYPPLAKFAARFGVVERAAPVLPVTIRRLEADAVARTHEPFARGEVAARHDVVDASDARRALLWLRALDAAQRETSVFASAGLPSTPKDVALPRSGGEDAFEVVGVPLAGPGLHVLEIESRILGQALLDPPGPLFVPAGALVTDLGVHLKWGFESSLVWVTTLSTAEPVAGARVTVVDCDGAQLFQGVSDASGLLRVEGLPIPDKARRCEREGYSDYDAGVLVVAAKDGDVGLAHSSWQEGIEPWRFGVPTAWAPASPTTHTIFDRMLLRAGDTVHMKHVLRRGVQEGFAQVAPEARPQTLRIVHVGSDQRWELPLAWSADGSATTDWTIPREAKLGVYEVQALPAKGEAWSEPSGSFRVEAFRVPLARGVIQPPKDDAVARSELPVDLAVTYLGGGAAAALPVQLRSQLRPRPAPAFPELETFGFAAGGVREGVRVRRFGEDETESWDFAGERGEEPGGAAAPVQTQSLVLDAGGTARATIAGLPAADTPLDLVTELEFRDPSGEVRTAARTIPLWPSSRLVGLEAREPAGPEAPLRVRAAVVDLRGDAVWRARVEIDAYLRRTYSTRTRLVGGFYAYEHVEEVKALGRFCEGRSDRRGVLACEAKAPAEGELVLVARTLDGAGRASTTRADVFVPGDDDSWFAQGDGDRMDLLPERRRLAADDTARIQVRMPFREATALVTVEREGVADAFVTKLSGRDPVVKVPLRGAFAPNVFVSVLALRGRVTGNGAPAPTARLDLAKPACRLGVTELVVGREQNLLRVEVEPAQEIWRVRETAKARIAVRAPGGRTLPAGAEVALAVVDEGLLELAPNTSWNLLDALMGRRSYAVETSTAQLQVVGKRHFGLKALPHGGGGGRQPTRELFDTLLLWRARVPLDALGRAEVQIPLNDSLTSFRIAAVATAGDDLFGTGSATIRTTQDLLALPGLPPVVREGDRFRAGLTLRNTTRGAKDVVVRAAVGGLASAPPPQSVRIAAGASEALGFDVDVPAGASALAWDVAIESGGQVVDRLRVSQRVVPAVPERVLQATLLQVGPDERGASVDVRRPADALPGRAAIDVALRPRLAGAQDGVARAMREYPYSCLEQRVSTAVALRDAARWAQVVESLPGHLDEDGLAKFFPTMLRGSDVLTAHVLSLAHEAELALPAAPRDAMLDGLARFVTGALRQPLFAGDLELRKLAALAALARHGRATAEMTRTLSVQPALWPNASLLDWRTVVERTPGLAGREQRLAEVDAVLRTRLDVQGTSLGFARHRGTSRVPDAPWLLASGDVAATRLLLAAIAAPGWRADAPRLARGALAAQVRGAWPTTTGNAWGVLALEKFSHAFEAQPVAGATRAALAGAEQRLDWSAAPDGGVLGFAAPGAASRLALRHAGAGRPWALVQSRAAVPLREAFSSGYRVAKRLEAVSQRTPGAWSVGDVVRVRLDVDAEADATWVVVSDPIPAGATILGSGLGGDSVLATEGEAGAQAPWDAPWEAFTERGDEALRRYYERFPKGAFSVVYTLRLNQGGSFGLPPTRVEAMYQPERFGELPNARLEVAP